MCLDTDSYSPLINISVSYLGAYYVKWIEKKNRELIFIHAFMKILNNCIYWYGIQIYFGVVHVSNNRIYLPL